MQPGSSLRAPSENGRQSSIVLCQHLHLAYPCQGKSIVPVVLLWHASPPGAKTFFYLSTVHWSPCPLVARLHQQISHFWNYPDLGHMSLSQESVSMLSSLHAGVNSQKCKHPDKDQGTVSPSQIIYLSWPPWEVVNHCVGEGRRAEVASSMWGRAGNITLERGSSTLDPSPKQRDSCFAKERLPLACWKWAVDKNTIPVPWDTPPSCSANSLLWKTQTWRFISSQNLKAAGGSTVCPLVVCSPQRH